MLVKCEDGSGIVPPSLRRYKLHCRVDAGWIAGIEVNNFSLNFLQLNDVLLEQLIVRWKHSAIALLICEKITCHNLGNGAIIGNLLLKQLYLAAILEIC